MKTLLAEALWWLFGAFAFMVSLYFIAYWILA